MRVVVTGANGFLGRIILPLLREEGMEVMELDKEMAWHPGIAGIIQYKADLCDLGQVFGALAGADAVVHLGAISGTGGLPPEVIYSNNVISQFNVFEAAARLGIRRVVSASSLAALGFPFQHRWSEPLYLPIDEAHPLLPQHAYSLSKANGEEIAAAYCRRTGWSAASLRISHIVEDDGIRGIHKFLLDVRQKPGDSAPEFWAYIHVNDVARACLLALTRPFEGHEAFYITADDTSSELPTDELLARYYPNVPRQPGKREGRWAPVQNTHAREVLGFVPRYRWPDEVTLPPAEE
jgi:UDP-glucose 4-epimerase